MLNAQCSMRWDLSYGVFVTVTFKLQSSQIRNTNKLNGKVGFRLPNENEQNIMLPATVINLTSCTIPTSYQPRRMTHTRCLVFREFPGSWLWWETRDKKLEFGISDSPISNSQSVQRAPVHNNRCIFAFPKRWRHKNIMVYTKKYSRTTSTTPTTRIVSEWVMNKKSAIFWCNVSSMEGLILWIDWFIDSLFCDILAHRVGIASWDSKQKVSTTRGWRWEWIIWLTILRIIYWWWIETDYYCSTYLWSNQKQKYKNK